MEKIKGPVREYSAPATPVLVEADGKGVTAEAINALIDIAEAADTVMFTADPYGYAKLKAALKAAGY